MRGYANPGYAARTSYQLGERRAVTDLPGRPCRRSVVQTEALGQRRRNPLRPKRYLGTGPGEVHVGQALERGLHGVEHRDVDVVGDRRTDEVRRVTWVASNAAGRDLGREPDKRLGGVLLGAAGLAAEWPASEDQRRHRGGAAVALVVVGLALHRTAGRVGGGGRDVLAYDPLALWRGHRQRLTARRLDRRHRQRLAVDAAGRDGGVRIDQLQRRGRDDAEGERAPAVGAVVGQVPVVRGVESDAETISHGDRVFRADLLLQPDEVGVDRAA